MIDLTDKDFCVAFWFLASTRTDLAPDTTGGDYFAVLYRPEGVDSLQLVYRFRYYKGPGMFDEDQDEKNWYRVDMSSKSDDEAISVVDDITKKLVTDGFMGTRLPWKVKEQSFRRVVRASGREMYRAMMECPFMHMKVVTPEERDRIERARADEKAKRS